MLSKWLYEYKKTANIGIDLYVHDITKVSFLFGGAWA